MESTTLYKVIRESENAGVVNQASESSSVNVVQNGAADIIGSIFKKSTRLTKSRKLAVQMFLNDATAEPWRILYRTESEWKHELLHRFRFDARCRAYEITMDDVNRWMKYPAFSWQLRNIITAGLDQHAEFLRNQLHGNLTGGHPSQIPSLPVPHSNGNILHNMSIPPPVSLNPLQQPGNLTSFNESSTSLSGGVHPGMYPVAMPVPQQNYASSTIIENEEAMRKLKQSCLKLELSIPQSIAYYLRTLPTPPPLGSSSTESNSAVGAQAAVSLPSTMTYNRDENITNFTDSLNGAGRGIVKPQPTILGGVPSVAKSYYFEEVPGTSTSIMQNGGNAYSDELLQVDDNLSEGSSSDVFPENWIDPSEFVEVILRENQDTLNLNKPRKRKVKLEQVEPMDLRKKRK